jgi:hypothetical protein
MDDAATVERISAFNNRFCLVTNSEVDFQKFLIGFPLGSVEKKYEPQLVSITVS